MADVLIALEMWLLCAALLAWLASRAAETLAGPETVTVSEADIADLRAVFGSDGANDDLAEGWGSLAPAVRLFDTA